MNKATIIQWNCRGFRKNFEDIKLLTSNEDAAVICLQETYLRPSDNCSLKGYTCHSTFSTADNGRPIGGSSILTKNNIPHQIVILNTPLQAVAVQIHLHRLITVCSIYLPPSLNYNLQDLNNLYQQLPQPVLLLGDFNAHSTLWGCNTDSNDSCILESFIEKEDLVILNDGSHTFLHPGNGALNAIDLSICSPTLSIDFMWNTANDQYGSDHFPIFISTNIPEAGNISRWQLRRANWEIYQSVCQEEIIQEKFIEQDDPIESFQGHLDVQGLFMPQRFGCDVTISRALLRSARRRMNACTALTPQRASADKLLV